MLRIRLDLKLARHSRRAILSRGVRSGDFWSCLWWVLSLHLLILHQALALDPTKLPSQYTLDQWEAEEGLPSASVWGITQTKDGYLWAATEEGLARFDGMEFKRFSSADTPAFLNNALEHLVHDQAGRLWFGTASGGVIRYENGTFTRFGLEDGLSDESMAWLIEDPKGRIHAGTIDGGHFIFQNDRFELATKTPHLRTSFRARAAADHTGGIWIPAGTNGLARIFDGSVTGYDQSSGLPPGAASPYVDRFGVVWALTGDGLRRLEGDHFVPGPPSVKGIRVNGMYEDPTGEVWLATATRGLFRLRDGRWSRFSSRQGQDIEGIQTLFMDQENNLWLGTQGYGLLRLKDGDFTSFGTPEGLPRPLLRSIYEATDGSLWLGSQAGGVARFHNDTITHFSTQQGLPSDDVFAIVEDTSGTLWIGTVAGGLAWFDGSAFHALSPEQGGAPTRTLYRGPDGTVWVGYQALGLGKLEGKRAVLVGESTIPRGAVRSILQDDQGALWVGYNYDGLYRLKDGQWTGFTKKDGLASDLIFSLLQSRDGALWIGSYGGGLTRFKEGKFSVISTRQGLYDDVIHTLFEDAMGYLWMSSNRAVSRVSLAELNQVAAGAAMRVSPRIFGRPNGMRTGECNSGQGWKDRKGRLWFPTIRGAAVVDPARLVINRRPPPVLLQDMIVDEEPQDLNAPILLDADTEKITFRFISLSLVDSKHNQYRYWLENFDRSWTNAGTRREAYYQQLPPGEYHFRFNGTNNDGVWGQNEKSITFRVEPEFYQTPWFRLAVAIVLLFLPLIAYKTAVYRAEASRKTLELLVESRTRELTWANANLERLTREDALTGVANRRHLDEHLEAEFRRSVRNGQPLSLILLDVDYFKQFNDGYGHPAGDQCLQTLGALLKEHVRRAGDLVARYGGEEFAIALASTTLEQALRVAEGLRKAVEGLHLEHRFSPGPPIVTVSLGVTTLAGETDISPEDLIAAADAALYAAKEAGRNRIAAASISSAPKGVPPAITVLEQDG